MINFFRDSHGAITRARCIPNILEQYNRFAKARIVNNFGILETRLLLP